jgi:hypothetical protein
MSKLGKILIVLLLIAVMVPTVYFCFIVPFWLGVGTFINTDRSNWPLGVMFFAVAILIPTYLIYLSRLLLPRFKVGTSKGSTRNVVPAALNGLEPSAGTDIAGFQ